MRATQSDPAVPSLAGCPPEPGHPPVPGERPPFTYLGKSIAAGRRTQRVGTGPALTAASGVAGSLARRGRGGAVEAELSPGTWSRVGVAGAGPLSELLSLGAGCRVQAQSSTANVEPRNLPAA